MAVQETFQVAATVGMQDVWVNSSPTISLPLRPITQGCGPLFYAANNREAAAAEAGLQLLLAAGADACARAYGGLTPLHTAARNGSPEAAAGAVRLLVAAGADIEAQLDSSAGGGRPLHMAVAANDSPAGMEAAVAALLAGGACVDAHNSRGGQTALHIAATRCSGGKAAVGAMRALLSAGASVLAVDAEGRQPLHLAIGASDTALEAVQVLLEGGADPNAACLGSGGQACGGWRPLHAVALLPDGHAAAQLVALLVSAGARVDAADAAGSTALMWTARNEHRQQAGSSSGSSGGSAEPTAAAIAAAFLAAGASLAACDSAGSTALHCAAAAAAHNSAAPQLIATLLEAGAEAKLEAEDAGKQTPLQLAVAAAAQGGGAGAAAVQVLLEAGASAGPLLRLL